MTHPVDPEAVETLAEWLCNGLSAKKVRSKDDEDRTTYVFTALGQAGDRFELEVSYEALEKAPVDEIIATLESRSAIGLLQQEPTVRLFYSSLDGLIVNEQRRITCDGRQYVVSRTRHDRVVDIHDANQQRLTGMPDGPSPLPASIHCKDDDHWCDKVRAWRGPSQ